ncbi:MAG: PatA/PatG family cyanobactin maturation protease [Pseudomonadota bacterium]
MPPGLGSRSVRIAVLDGRVDLEHDCFRSSTISQIDSLIPSEVPLTDAMAAHGTHITSIIFGQHGSDVEGLAPHCTGIVIPVFCEARRSVSQLDLARAIELAVDHGAHIINISGGQLTDEGEADVWLHNAMRLCRDRNVLVVAAAGNDGCECLHVPAALPMVLAVGALDSEDRPLEFSNWGAAYRAAGLMAPGQNILGAKPGGGTARRSGTSFAAPIVTAAAALLLSHQADRGETPDPHQIRQLLLESARSCDGVELNASGRCLAGKLNLAGAFKLLTGRRRQMTTTSNTVSAAVSPQCACDEGDQIAHEPEAITQAEADGWHGGASPSAAPFLEEARSFASSAVGGSGLRDRGSDAGERPSAARAVTASAAPDTSTATGMVYALGLLGYDFGSEARRDSFKQLMPPSNQLPANPYDSRQMVDYLANNLAEARSLIWTLNIELTPVYAIEPVGAFARDVYEVFRAMLAGEILAETDPDFIQRVSIPGLLTGRTVRLFSGQVVPVIEPVNTRGMYGWKTNSLIDSALNLSAGSKSDSALDGAIRLTLDGFLNRVYYDLRNLGRTSHDRALNFAVTNAFQVATTFSDALVAGMQLDEISVEKSPFCRMDSDCWDVKLKFFDPENSNRAKRIYRFTVDVSDLIPVTMGEVRSWTSAD